MSIYGYCRISTKKQSIERQVRNIYAVYPSAVIVREVYTGTKTAGRGEWGRLMKVVRRGDTIVFDSVSRMSRNATDGFELYKQLFQMGVNLVFLKEPHINTDTYKGAMQNRVELTGDDVDLILDGINRYLFRLAERQIILAFEQAEKEVTDLHQRTREGIETARLNGKQIGLKKGTCLVTKKSIVTKQGIRKYSKDFEGVLKDVECMKILGVSRNTYYKYKRELMNEG